MTHEFYIINVFSQIILIKTRGESVTQLKNILYLGWLGKGNVGDDVLFELFKVMFYKYHQSERKTFAEND